MAATAVAAFPEFMAAATSDATIYANGHGAFQQKPWDRQTKVHLYTQLVMSSILGVGAFLTFCVCDISRDLGRVQASDDDLETDKPRGVDRTPKMG